MVDAALARAQRDRRSIISMTATARRPIVLLPAASFAEGDGTLVSKEGRAQRFFQVYRSRYYDARILVREGWRWLHALHCTLQGSAVDWTKLDEVTGRLRRRAPRTGGIAAGRARLPRSASRA